MTKELGNVPLDSKINASRDDLVAKRWDVEYANGKYRGEKPATFIDDIRLQIEANSDSKGLYVGCGNGRNYIPLVQSGMSIIGIDISQYAIDNILERFPEYRDSVFCTSFAKFKSEILFDFIIAIQVFQHGADGDVSHNFNKVRNMLKRGGVFCLRVNSISTDIRYEHSVVEKNDLGGRTIRYKEGPKKDLLVHFFTSREIKHYFTDFDYIMKPREKIIPRKDPKTGNFVQWEMIMKKANL